jgi:hypothetical protein
MTAVFVVTLMRTSSATISVSCHETAIFIVTPVRNWNLMISVTCHETAIFIITPVRNGNLMTSVTCHETALFIVTPVRNWNFLTSVTCHETAIFIVTPVRNWNLMTSVTCHETAIFIVTPVRNWNLMTSVTCHETAIFTVTPLRASGTKDWRFWSDFFNVKWHISTSNRLPSEISSFHAIPKRTVFSSQIKKFFEFSWTKMFITISSTVHHWTVPSWVPSNVCLHILFPWGLYVPPYKLSCSHLFVEGIPSEILLAFPYSMYRKSHSPPFVLSNDKVWWRSRTDHEASLNIAIKVPNAHLHVSSPQTQPPYQYFIKKSKLKDSGLFAMDGVSLREC